MSDSLDRAREFAERRDTNYAQIWALIDIAESLRLMRPDVLSKSADSATAELVRGY